MSSKDIPPIPDAGTPPDLRRVLSRMREELQRLTGARGTDPALRASGGGSGFSGGGGGGVGGGSPGGGGTGSYVPDLTPPPTPTFGSGDVVAGFAQVIVSWAGITYTQGHGHKQTLIYAVKKAASDPTLPTFPGDPGLVAAAPNGLTLISLPSEPATRWHVWLKFETVDGVKSVSPAGGTNGISDTTGQDVDAVVRALTGPGKPFTILDTPTTIDGVAYPAGTYTTLAFIMDAQISRVKIKDEAVDNSKIANLSAAKLTVGDGTVGGNLKSTTYTGGAGGVPGAGWLLTPGGDFFANNAVLYGTVYARSGLIGGNTIDATGVQSPGYTAGSSGWRLDSSGIIRSFASSGQRVLDMAATGTAPVLKIGSALELLANGDAFFGGRLAVGAVSANGSSGVGLSIPSLPDSALTYTTGIVAFSPPALITCSGGNMSAIASFDIRVAASATSVSSIRVFGSLFRNGVEVDKFDAHLAAVAFPDPAGGRRVITNEVTLLSPLSPLTGAQEFTYSISVQFWNSSGVQISPGPDFSGCYLQALGRINFQEIKV